MGKTKFTGAIIFSLLLALSNFGGLIGCSGCVEDITEEEVEALLHTILGTPDDADQDGITDDDEIVKFGTDIGNPDTDGDGLSDYEEINYDGDDAEFTPYVEEVIGWADWDLTTEEGDVLVWLNAARAMWRDGLPQEVA